MMPTSSGSFFHSNRGRMSSIIHSNCLLSPLPSGEFLRLDCADGFLDIRCDDRTSTRDVPSVAPCSDPSTDPLVYLPVRRSLCLPAISCEFCLDGRILNFFNVKIDLGDQGSIIIL